MEGVPTHDAPPRAAPDPFQIFDTVPVLQPTFLDQWFQRFGRPPTEQEVLQFRRFHQNSLQQRNTLLWQAKVNEFQASLVYGSGNEGQPHQRRAPNPRISRQNTNRLTQDRHNPHLAAAGRIAAASRRQMLTQRLVNRNRRRRDGRNPRLGNPATPIPAPTVGEGLPDEAHRARASQQGVREWDQDNRADGTDAAYGPKEREWYQYCDSIIVRQELHTHQKTNKRDLPQNVTTQIYTVTPDKLYNFIFYHAHRAQRPRGGRRRRDDEIRFDPDDYDRSKNNTFPFLKNAKCMVRHLSSTMNDLIVAQKFTMPLGGRMLPTHITNVLVTRRSRSTNLLSITSGQINSNNGPMSSRGMSRSTSSLSSD